MSIVSDSKEIYKDIGIIQGVFLHWVSPKKYGEPRLGESTLT